MSIMAKTPSGYKKIGSAYLGERPVDKVFNANGDVVYALQRELTGVPPLLFKGKEQSELLNYRIYGDTVDGESVGDRTGNLFDGAVEQGSFQGTNGDLVDSPKRVRSIGIQLSGGNYTISATGCDNVILLVYSTAADYILSESTTKFQDLPFSFSLNDERIIRFALKKNDNSNILPSDISNIMLNEGSTALPYEPYGYKVPVTVSNGADTLTTPIYLPEPIKMVGDEAEYIDYGEQKLHRVRKNLLKNTATSQTINGITLTVNTDGSVTCNGRRENTSTFFTIAKVTTSGKIILSGCPSGGSSASFAIRAFSATVSNPRVYYDIGDSCMLNTPDTYNIDIRIQSNYACDNLTFYPIIRKADIEDDTYEPYIENTEVDVTLPALPTIKGTNTMSVDTAVQPSRMDIKGRIKTTT